MIIKKKGGKNEIAMGSVSRAKYIKRNITKDWLLFNGFHHYNRLFSDAETEVYTYRFPVCKYEKFTILECELKVIIGEDNIHINVYDYNTLNRYAPFYYSEYRNYTVMLKEIWQKIDKELNKLGIKKVTMAKENGNGSKNKEIERKRNDPNKRK